MKARELGDADGEVGRRPEHVVYLRVDDSASKHYVEYVGERHEGPVHLLYGIMCWRCTEMLRVSVRTPEQSEVETCFDGLFMAQRLLVLNVFGWTYAESLAE
jgi:hypothetical protein